jgi:hypothetical protein
MYSLQPLSNLEPTSKTFDLVFSQTLSALIVEHVPIMTVRDST